MKKFIKKLRSIFVDLYKPMEDYPEYTESCKCDAHMYIYRMIKSNGTPYRLYRRGKNRCPICGCYDTLDPLLVKLYLTNNIK